MIGSDGTPVEESDSSDDDGSEEDCEDDDACSSPMSKQRETQASTRSTSMPTLTSTFVESTVSKVMTSTSGGLSSEYMVFPTAGATLEELTALAENLTDELGTDNVLSVSLNDVGDQTMYVITRANLLHQIFGNSSLRYATILLSPNIANSSYS